MEQIVSFLKEPSSHALTLFLGMMVYHMLWGRQAQKRLDAIVEEMTKHLSKLEGPKE